MARIGVARSSLVRRGPWPGVGPFAAGSVSLTVRRVDAYHAITIVAEAATRELRHGGAAVASWQRLMPTSRGAVYRFPGGAAGVARDR